MSSSLPPLAPASPAAPALPARSAHALSWTAWFAHVYTASGAVLAFLSILAVVSGRIREAFFWLAIAVVVDSSDGVLARAFRVRERLPDVNGAHLDDIVDYLTFVFVPAFLLYQTGRLAAGWGLAVVSAVLVVSVIAFSKGDAKTPDHFFTGFPSYWNIVAFYLYVLKPPAWVSMALIAALALLTFVPTPYIYATRGGPFARLINIGALLWFVLLGLVLLGTGGDPRALALVTLVYPVTYLALSASITMMRKP